MIKFFIIVLLLVASAYPFSYAIYVWRKKNYFGALGMVFLVLASIVTPAYILIVR